MRNLTIILALMGFLATPFVTIQAQEVSGDDILGVWLNEDKDAHVDIYKEGDKFYGKVVWLEEPNEFGAPKLDKENADPQLAKRPIMGLSIVKNFIYDASKERWVEGSIYDPKNGKTYDCYAWFEDGDFNNLYIKGYVAGIKALGRKTTWEKKK